MLLAIDIGNTNVTFGVFDAENIKATWRVSTAIHRTPDEYAHLMLSLMERQGISATKLKDVVTCSVVPPLLIIFEEVCKRFLGAH
jgi:type III pantothenate kinase